MWVEIALVSFGALLLSALLTEVTRRFALSHGLLDMPNERSSHAIPTPRSGGIGIVAATLVSLVALALLGVVPIALFMALAGGGLAVAVIGFVDDRHKLSAGTRLAVHVAAAVWGLAWFGGLPPLQIGERVVELGWAGDVLGVLGIVWTLNLFNFMDGIDGIAASEAIFVTWAGATLAVIAGVAGGLPAAGIAFGAACVGFLVWNWHPAKIFMGDVGSGFLGFTISMLAIAATRDHAAAPFVGLILAGAFVVDSGVTLLRRIMRGERVYQAHRTHAYQWLARCWRSHERVTLATMVVNCCWLLPWAFLAAVFSESALWISAAALAPLAILAVMAGAGRAETDDKAGASRSASTS